MIDDPLDRVPDNTPTPPMLDEEGARNFVEQVLSMWVEPEIRRRLDSGLVPEPFVLVGAQVLFPPAGDNVVRLNEEVRGLATTQFNRAIEAGDHVYLDDVDTMEGFELDEAELDNGHITIFRLRDKWVATFNLLSQRGRATKFLDRALEFHGAASDAYERGHASPAVDNLFSACELAAKAMLLLSRDLPPGKTNHKAIMTRANFQSRMGNINAAFMELLNTLADLRYPYRYDANYTVQMPMTADDLELARAVILDQRARIGPKLS